MWSIALIIFSYPYKMRNRYKVFWFSASKDVINTSAEPRPNLFALIGRSRYQITLETGPSFNTNNILTRIPIWTLLPSSENSIQSFVIVFII